MDILSSSPLTSLLKVFQDGHPIEDFVEELINSLIVLKSRPGVPFPVPKNPVF